MKRMPAMLVCVAASALVIGVPSPARGQAVRHLQPPRRAAGPFGATPAASQQARRGYLVPDPAGLARAKATATSRHVALAPPDPSSPVAFRSWKGVYDTSVSPPDSTGAIGPTRYIELVNDQFGIYDRTNNTALSSGTIATLTGDASGSLTDPQILWDPGTARFYYVVLDTSSNVFDVGFSTTDTPTTAADWCQYTDDPGYGSSLPDYPKLGDTQDFLLIGVNVGLYLRSDVDWVTKPAPGPTCPSAGSFRTGQKQTLKNADGTKAVTPVPVNQIDTSAGGWIIAAKDLTGSTRRTLSLFSVTTNPDGTANIAGTATSVIVSTYALPPPAPQKGTTAVLDTMDGRLTQAVSAIDPTIGSVVIWTQHTISGGAGVSLDVFNGAIAPDRAMSAGGSAFGDAMVLAFDTSSSSTDVAFQMVSKIGASAQSAFVLVRQSAGPNVDFTCFAPDGPPCRWGDYAGASPDPAATLTGSHGQVWLTDTYNVSSTNNTNVDWRTQNVGAAP
ncbi:MAG: hypothetical protein E6G47_06355 [Actinobacteria bacterium]|nr:MAG: hypothetical protein E6G47_06355 [Actinomycetota bacterium]